MIKGFLARVNRNNKVYSPEQLLKLKRKFAKKVCSTIYQKENIIQFLSVQKNHKYGMPGDCELTAEQIDLLNRFWEKYSFFGNIDYTDVQDCINRNGNFDVKYIPQYVFHRIIKPILVPDSFTLAYQNKAFLDVQLKGVKCPPTVLRGTQGIIYDSECNAISQAQAIEICKSACEVNELVFKPSFSAGGRGITFIGKDNTEIIEDTLTRMMKGTFIVQKVIEQHPEMAKLNASGLNTIRVFTIRKNAEIIPLAAFLKVAAVGSRVDNFHAGSTAIGVHMDGTITGWGINPGNEKVTVLPSGVKLGSDFTRIPCWSSVIETVKSAHYRMPNVMMTAWDVAVDSNNEAVIIEPNHAPDIRVHQLLTGPLFGEHTEYILDYVLSKYSKTSSFEEYIICEYNDHVSIKGYIGDETEVVIPNKIKGKKVTALENYSFAFNNKLESITLGKYVKKVNRGSFMGCCNLQALNGDINKIVFSNSYSEQFMGCDKLPADAVNAALGI